MSKLSKDCFRVGVITVLLMSAFYAMYYLRSTGDIIMKTAGRTVQLNYNFAIQNINDNSENIKVWVPMPLSNAHQKLLGFHILGSKSYKVVEEATYKNRFIFFDLDPAKDIHSDKSTIEIAIKFNVTRFAIDPLHKNSKDKNVSSRQLARFLGPNRLIPIDGKIAEEAQRTAGSQSDPMKKSKKLYDNIVETLSYDKSGEGWGRGDALFACNARRGNCTDFHSLFIGQSRSLDIPARFIIGFPLPQNTKQGDISGYHCWGEFYQPKYGWLPVDASEAHKNPEKKEAYFAQLDQHRIAFTIGRDIKLPGSKAEPLNYVIYPHVEIDGRTHEKVVMSFSFEDREVSLAN